MNKQYECFTDEDWEKQMALPLPRQDSSFCKRSIYHVSLWYNRINSLIKRNWPWWSEVINDSEEHIYLGAIPLIRLNITDSSNDLINLEKLGIGAVLSAVEVYELYPSGFTSPVTGQQWRDVGIKHLQIHTPDFLPITLDNIKLGVEFIRWNVNKGRPIYIHCKAGRGRSVLILACYLLKYHRDKYFTLEEAIAFIKSKRPHAKLEKIKRACGNKYLTFIRNV